MNLKGNISENDIREIKKGTECINYRGPDDHNEYYVDYTLVSLVLCPSGRTYAPTSCAMLCARDGEYYERSEENLRNGENYLY